MDFLGGGPVNGSLGLAQYLEGREGLFFHFFRKACPLDNRPDLFQPSVAVRVNMSVFLLVMMSRSDGHFHVGAGDAVPFPPADLQFILAQRKGTQLFPKLVRI